MFNVSFISDIDTAKLYVQFLRSQTCSRLGLLTVEATLPSSCFVRSFQLLYLGLSVFAFISCLQNVHFSMTMLPPNIRIFAIFFAIFQTSTLVDRSIHDYAVGVAVLFRVKSVYLSRYSQKKQGRSSRNRLLQLVCFGFPNTGHVIILQRTNSF